MEVGNTPKSESYGLKSAILSPGETLAQSVALIAPTGTPLMAVPLVYALAGQGCAIAYLISTITIVLVALNVNQFARISSSPGSLYTYIAEHTHPILGMLSGWALLIAYVGTAAAVSAGCANYIDVLLRDLFGVPVFPFGWALLAVAVSCWMAYRDVQVSARLMLYLEGVSILLILIVAFGIIWQYGWRLDMAQLTLQGVTASKLRMGLVMAMFSSVGFESATSLGSEARDPLKTIPRAVLWSAILAGLFFFTSAYAEVLGFRGEAETLDKSGAPLHLLAHKAGLPAVIGTLTDVGAVISFFGCVLACLTAAARVLFLMGRQGALHAVLGEAHEINQTPHRAVLLSAVASFLPAGIMTLVGFGVFEIYGLLGTLATFGFVTAYIMIALAAPFFLKAQGRLTWQAFAVSALAVLAMGAALLGSIYPVPPGAYALLPYIYVVLLFAGLTWSVVWSTRTPMLAEGSS
jgi:amino acid transporter